MIDIFKINWEAFGSKFANLSDKDQGAFFAGLARELKTWETQHHKEMQGYSVSNHLRASDKQELEKFLSILWLEDK
jgi:hypothetical protein